MQVAARGSGGNSWASGCVGGRGRCESRGGLGAGRLVGNTRLGRLSEGEGPGAWTR